MSNPLQIIKQTDEALNVLNAKLSQTHKNLAKISEEARKAGKSLGVSSGKGVSKTAKERNIIQERANALMREQERIRKRAIQTLARYEAAQTRWARKTAENNVNLREQNRLNRENAILTSRMTSEYQKLVVKMNQAGRRYQELVAKQAQGIRLSKSERRELRQKRSDFNKYERAVMKADRAIKRHQRNVGNYTRTLGFARAAIMNFVAAFGLVGGVTMFAQLAIDSFNLVKKLDSLGFAMKAVIKDQMELAQTQEWLRKTTNAFGAEVVSTTERYIKFRAAAQNAGFTALQTQKIFGTMTKAAGVLGLRTDELTGIYLALEQMISKGKITTEELRRQLGERLPAAMDIMAQSMGVTTSELDAMMKKGEVITAEVLPKFAEQVEIAFGIESVEKVETLQAATIRLRNAYTELIQETNDQFSASNKLMKVFDFLADNLNEIVDWVYRLVKAWVIYKGIMLATNTVVKIATALQWAWRFAVLASSQGIRAATAAMLGFNAAAKANPLGAVISLLAAATAAYVAFKDKVGDAADAQEALNRAIQRGIDRNLRNKEKDAALVENQIREIKKVASEAKKSAKDEIERREIESKSIADQTKVLEENIKAKKEEFDANVKKIKQLQSGETVVAIDEEQRERQRRRSEAEIKRLQNKNILLAELKLSWEDQLEMLEQTGEASKKIDKDSVAGLRIQIKDQKDLLEATKKRSEAIPIQQEILRLEKDIEKILGVQGKKSIQAAENSIGYFEEKIRLLEVESKKIATTAEEYELLQARIEGYRRKIREIKREFEQDDSFGATDLFPSFEEALKQMNISTFGGLMDNLAVRMKQPVDQLYQEYYDLYGNDLSHFKEFLEQKLDAAVEAAEMEKQINEEVYNRQREIYAGLGKLVSTMFDRDIQRYDDALERNRLYYAEILNNEQLTVQQRDAIEAERDRKELQLEKKKRDVERKKAIASKGFSLFEIAIDTAKTVSEIKGTAFALQAAALRNPLLQPLVNLAFAQIPLALTSAAIQAGIVAAQPIPQFEKGKGAYDNYEGAAIWGEKRQEAKISKDGTITLSPKKAGYHLTHVKKDDIIHPDAKKFLQSLNTSETGQRAFNWSQNDTGEVVVVDSGEQYAYHAERMIKAINKKQMSFKVNQTLNIGDDLKFLQRKADTL